VLLSVKAGAQGQKFDDRVLAKIEHVRALRDDLPLIIDGGLGVEEIKRCIAAEWAQEMSEDELRRNLLDIHFAVGSQLFAADKLEEKLEALENLTQ
jgi:pentose-5-phosphate-3-epimerase